MLYLQGTYVQRNQWNDELGSDTQGAIVEYTTGAGETARSYTTTTDSQGNYTFAGLAPGVYTVQSTTHGTTSSQRVVIWPDQRDERVDFVNRSVTTSLRQTMTAQPTSTMTPTPPLTVTPTVTITATATIEHSTTWSFDALSGSSANSQTLSSDSTVMFCGTTFGSSFFCPSANSDSTTTFMRFTGTQYLGTTMPVNSNEMTVRMRVRTANATGGLMSVVSSFVLTTVGHDRDLYFENGKVCSRLWMPGEEVICTTNTYNDNMWHTIERGFMAGQTVHYLKVDNETVYGSAQSVAEWGPVGIVIGVCSRTNTNTCGSSGANTFFTGDIDYVTLGPVRMVNAQWDFTNVTGSVTYQSTHDQTGSWSMVCGNGIIVQNHLSQISTPIQCPSYGVDGSKTYVRFSGSQYLASAVRFASDTQWLSLEIRTTASNGGIFGVVDWFTPASMLHDQEIFLLNGKICSRLLQNGQTEVICTKYTYNNGQWYYVHRHFGLGNNTKHYLQVGTEAVQGNFTRSDYSDYKGIILGMSAYNDVASYFVGDIDYLYNAAYGIRNGAVR
jgi:hypothetical protein